MNVLVIGATGLLGAPAVRSLLQRGYQVTGVAREPAAPAGASRYRHIVTDRSQAALLTRAIDDAAPRGGYDAVVDVVAYDEIDVRGVGAATSCRTAHVVVISTTYLYDERASTPHTEHSPIASSRRLGGYCAGKVRAERAYQRLASEAGWAVTILRLPHVVGGCRELGVVPLHARDPLLLRRISAGWPLFLVEGGGQRIQIVDADDAARVIVATVGTASCFGRILNCANPRVLHARDYYNWVAQALERQARIIAVPPQPFFGSRWGWSRSAVSRAVDTSPIETEVGFTTWRDPEDSIRAWARSRAGESLVTGTVGDDPLRPLIDVIGGDPEELTAIINGLADRRERTLMDARMNREPLPCLG